MDISFGTKQGRFNYKVCAVITQGQRLLVMHGEDLPYGYLPGGRVQLGETAEQALLRELQEELGICAKLLRPLWLNQAFFTEEVSGEQYHEICLYYEVDISGTELLQRGETFSHMEDGAKNEFCWLPFAELAGSYLYPDFIKTSILHLPEHMEIIEEHR